MLTGHDRFRINNYPDSLHARFYEHVKDVYSGKTFQSALWSSTTMPLSAVCADGELGIAVCGEQ
jgi:hypothetical protein